MPLKLKGIKWRKFMRTDIQLRYELSSLLKERWAMRKQRPFSAKPHINPDTFIIEIDGVKIIEVIGPPELAKAVLALPMLLTHCSLAAYKVQTVLQNVGPPLNGHRVILNDAVDKLFEALTEAGRITTIEIEKVV
jgi:hypothetical protein